MTALWRMTAEQTAALVRSREVSATEVAENALARLEAVNPAINAVVACRPDAVLAQAAALDAALARGETVGPLAGVPVTTRVNTDEARSASTNGLRSQRDLIASEDNPGVANLREAGAILLGRTNTPAFSYRWFTNNLPHGATRNPRDPRLTPGGSSGGAAAAVTAGIGAIGQGTDIAGSVRYPAYACGIHGLRPSLGRIPAFNASMPERSIGGQLMATLGPLARTIGDLRLALAAMSRGKPRDPWWVPAPLTGPPAPRRVVLCLKPDELAIAPAVEAALLDAARRLEAAGWHVEPMEALPPLQEAADLQIKLWLGEGYVDKLRAAEAEDDPGALAVLRALEPLVRGVGTAEVLHALTLRATLVRRWQIFLADNPLVLLPISGDLPFADGADLEGPERFRQIWRSQLTQVAIPILGVPALSVSTGLVGTVPVGVQVIAPRFREDLCLAVGEAIEAGGVPPSPIDPAPIDPAPIDPAPIGPAPIDPA